MPWPCQRRSRVTTRNRRDSGSIAGNQVSSPVQPSACSSTIVGAVRVGPRRVGDVRRPAARQLDHPPRRDARVRQVDAAPQRGQRVHVPNPHVASPPDLEHVTVLHSGARTASSRPTPSGRSRWRRCAPCWPTSLDRDGGWAELAEAGLLGLAVPEAYGGEGLGLPEVGVLLRETGARADAPAGLGDALLRRPGRRRGGHRRAEAGAAARGRERRGAAHARRSARPGRPISGTPDHDVRRRHGHRPQDRRDLRRPGDPAAGPGDGRRHARWSRWSTSATPA